MIDVSALITAMLPALQAEAVNKLTFWTETELYQWASEALRRLARSAGVFVERDTSVTVGAGGSTYTLPERHLGVLRISRAGVELEPSTIHELESLSDSWETDAGIPDRWAGDGAGLDTIRIYPQWTAGGALDNVLFRMPADVTSGAPTVTTPAVVGDYITWRVLAEARRKESDAAMPEMADHFDQLAGLFEDVSRGYYGESL